MAWYVFCLTMILFFTQKQFGAGSRFTGASGTVKLIIQISAFCGAAMWLSELFCLITEVSFFFAIGVAITTMVGWYFLNKMVCRSVAKKFAEKHPGLLEEAREDEGADYLAWTYYNHECDLMTTKIALVGLIANPLLYYLRY